MGRHFLPILIFLLENFVQCTSEHDKKRLNCLKALQRAYEELDQWVSDTSAIVFKQEIRKHLLLYQELSEECGGEVFLAPLPKAPPHVSHCWPGHKP